MKSQTFSNWKGIHPADNKEQTAGKPIERVPLPKEVFIPLQQHIGAPCKPIVERKDKVKAGQIIGEATGFVSSPVHSSISGTVRAIDRFKHPMGMPVEMVHIVSDKKDEWVDFDTPCKDWTSLSGKEIAKRISDAGIVGMGGAAFPTHVKLSPPEDKPIDTLVVNGCECEPFLTADHRMMVEQAQDIVLGVRILCHALGVSRAIIGVEDNTPDAISSLSHATKDYEDFSVVPLKTKYPQGAEKFLIKATLDRVVPSCGLPMDVGVVVSNVATCIAAGVAITTGMPLVERVLTVTGPGIAEPKNVLARIGTPFQNIIDFCGGISDDTAQVIMGGPMMGISQASLDVPVVKATSGILCLTDGERLQEEEFACIKCGNCVRVCPLNLLPTRMASLTKANKTDVAMRMGILNCADCGCCAYVCPSNIPLVQWLRLGKLKIAEARQKAK